MKAALASIGGRRSSRAVILSGDVNGQAWWSIGGDLSWRWCSVANRAATF